MTWEPALGANAFVVSSILSSLVGTFPLHACISSMAVNFTIGALTFVAVSGATASTVSTVSTVSPMCTVSSPSTTPTATVAATLSEMGGAPRCVSKFFGEVGCSFFF